MVECPWCGEETKGEEYTKHQETCPQHQKAATNYARMYELENFFVALRSSIAKSRNDHFRLREFLETKLKLHFLLNEGSNLWCAIRTLNTTAYCVLLLFIISSPWWLLSLIFMFNQIGNLVLNIILYVVWWVYISVSMLLAFLVGYIRES